MVQMRDEGFKHWEMYADPMAARIPNYTYVTTMIDRDKSLDKILKAMREGPLHYTPASQGPRMSEYTRASYTSQELLLSAELAKRRIPYKTQVSFESPIVGISSSAYSC
jgi:hypothetical protein